VLVVAAAGSQGAGVNAHVVPRFAAMAQAVLGVSGPRTTVAKQVMKRWRDARPFAVRASAPTATEPSPAPGGGPQASSANDWLTLATPSAGSDLVSS
jgi:hypothetical protein